MNDLQVLRDFCAEETPPEPQQLAGLRARVLASFDAAPASRPSRMPRRRVLAWPRFAPMGAALAVVAIAVTTALVIPSAPAPSPVRLDAATVLHRAAKAALAAPVPHGRRYTYAVTVGGVGRNLNSITKVWVSIDGKRRSTAWTNNCGFKGDPGCFMWLQPLPLATGFFSYASVGKLPTAPAPLLDGLYREQSRACASANLVLDHAGTEWSGIYTILNDVPVLPPRFGAALFDAAARIPGVTVIRHVKLNTGQHGIAVVRTVHPVKRSGNVPYTKRAELIFNPHTYRYMGSVEYNSGGPSPVASTLVATTFVNAAPYGPSAYVMPLPECIGF